MNNAQLIGPFKQIVTLENSPLKGALQDKDIAIIEDGAIILQGEKIKEVGSFDLLKKDNNHLDFIEIKHDAICIPGIIDCHTHICFAGSRARDYAMRNAGKTYLEIAKMGGGIWDTVQHTRKASKEELTEGIINRANTLLSRGITTVEVKSGYGLSIDDELKMLEAIKVANNKCTTELISTCLAAHIKPKDFDGNHKTYLEYISSNLFPILKQKSLTNRIDIFIEDEAFDIDISREYLKKAKDHGFEITIHADQFTPGGSRLAVELNALSADHLEASGEPEITVLANSDVISVALPGASIGLGCAFTPARKLLDAGASLAISSDWNPGSAPMGDLVLQAAILGTFEKLSNAELLAGITYRAAAALNLTDRGTISKDKKADFCIYDTDHYNEIFYHQGKLLPSIVFKNGKIAHSTNY